MLQIVVDLFIPILMMFLAVMILSFVIRTFVLVSDFINQALP